VGSDRRLAGSPATEPVFSFVESFRAILVLVNFLYHLSISDPSYSNLYSALSISIHAIRAYSSRLDSSPFQSIQIHPTLNADRCRHTDAQTAIDKRHTCTWGLSLSLSLSLPICLAYSLSLSLFLSLVLFPGRSVFFPPRHPTPQPIAAKLYNQHP